MRNPLLNGVKPVHDKWCGPMKHSDSHGITWLILAVGTLFIFIVTL